LLGGVLASSHVAPRSEPVLIVMKGDEDQARAFLDTNQQVLVRMGAFTLAARVDWQLAQ